MIVETMIKPGSHQPFSLLPVSSFSSFVFLVLLSWFCSFLLVNHSNQFINASPGIRGRTCRMSDRMCSQLPGKIHRQVIPRVSGDMICIHSIFLSWNKMHTCMRSFPCSFPGCIPSGLFSSINTVFLYYRKDRPVIQGLYLRRLLTWMPMSSLASRDSV